MHRLIVSILAVSASFVGSAQAEQTTCERLAIQYEDQSKAVSADHVGLPSPNDPMTIAGLTIQLMQANQCQVPTAIPSDRYHSAAHTCAMAMLTAKPSVGPARPDTSGTPQFGSVTGYADQFANECDRSKWKPDEN